MGVTEKIPPPAAPPISLAMIKWLAVRAKGIKIQPSYQNMALNMVNAFVDFWPTKFGNAIQSRDFLLPIWSASRTKIMAPNNPPKQTADATQPCSCLVKGPFRGLLSDASSRKLDEGQPQYAPYDMLIILTV